MDGYNNRRDVFRNLPKKPERYSRDSFVKEVIGKTVRISLVSGKEVQGRLLELGMFDIKVQTAEGPVIIMKGAIATVQVMA